MLTRARHSRWVVALALLALLLSACATVDRTVEDKRLEGDLSGNRHYIVVWDSDRYPAFDADVSEACYDQALFGQPVPEGCVRPLHVLLEANPYRASANLAFIASLLVMGALTAFTLRFIGWRPRIRPDAAEQAALQSQHAEAPAAVRLMHAVSGERRARDEATARGRDIPNPARAGVIAGVALLVPATLLFGYGAALAWGAITAVLTLLALGFVELSLLLPFVPPHVDDPHVPIARMLFLAGVCGAFLLLALQAALISTPLHDLHGLALLA